jgi:hypothetical protein
VTNHSQFSRLPSPKTTAAIMPRMFVRRGFTGCGKIPKVSFRGRGLPEESAFFLGLVKKQIPRFARDGIKLLFSAASLAASSREAREGV